MLKFVSYLFFMVRQNYHIHTTEAIDQTLSITGQLIMDHIILNNTIAVDHRFIMAILVTNQTGAPFRCSDSWVWFLKQLIQV